MTRSNIAAAINDAHERVEASKRAGVQAATECGRLLLEAKETVQHGKWDGWLKAHCRFSSRTAQLYMKVARYLEDGDPAKAQRVADLSLREVARIIAKSAEKRPPLTGEVEAEVGDIAGAWDSSSPAAKEQFARRLHEQGGLSLDQRNSMIAAAWTPDGLTEAQEDEAAKATAELMQKALPPELFKTVAAGLAGGQIRWEDFRMKIMDAMDAKRKALR